MAQPFNVGMPNQAQPICDSSSFRVTRPWFLFFANLLNNGVPTGTILQYAGASVPSGYHAADGSTQSRSVLSALNAVASSQSYGAPFGPGDGYTTFALPHIASAGGYQYIVKT